MDVPWLVASPAHADTAGSGADPAALLAEAESELAAINDALRRLDEGTYGRCSRCGAELDSSGLEADPLLETCPECSA